MLNLTTKNNSSNEYADHVICSNCGSDILVDIGQESCPLCKMKGCLAWANENMNVSIATHI